MPVLALSLSAAVLLVPTATASASGGLAHQINQFRAANGVHKLRVSRSLNRSATRYARRLIRTDRFGHASRIQASSRFSSLGEVLAYKPGWRKSGRSALRMWMRSGGHRSTLLMRRFSHIGAGRARGRFGGRLVTIWVVQVGRR
jgi:uncharacterized protein YkwD